MRRRLRNQRGAALLETAITLPLILLVAVGIFEFGRAYQTWQVLTNAAREGARMAAVPGWIEDDVKARVKLYLQADGMDTTAVVTTVTPVAINVPGGVVSGVKVGVSYPYKYLILGPIAQLVQTTATFNQVTLTASTTMRSEMAAGL
jgi:Flp pilus assembly protein TadG